jgi:hypothetical protein
MISIADVLKGRATDCPSERAAGSDRPRPVASKRSAVRKKALSYAGIGIAMLTLIENTVMVTIRHTDNEPTASVAATASASREEATGAERPSKPAAVPGDRFIAVFL